MDNVTPLRHYEAGPVERIIKIALAGDDEEEDEIGSVVEEMIDPFSWKARTKRAMKYWFGVCIPDDMNFSRRKKQRLA